MELKEKIIKMKPDRSGDRSANRYNYQTHWAFIKLLEMFVGKEDFVLVMEYFDDIIVLENEKIPQKIDFYQIKTNDKKGVLTISSSNLLKKNIKENGNSKESFAEKLIENFSNFRNETNRIHFVSNKVYNFKLPEGNGNSKDKEELLFGDLDIKEIEKFKEIICKKCNYANCKEECKKILMFSTSDLDLKNYKETALGKFVNFMVGQGRVSVVDLKAVFNSIISEITKISNYEKDIESFAKLIEKKSVTKKNFSAYLDEVESIDVKQANWLEISNTLLHEGLGSIKIKKIKTQFEQVKIDKLNNIDSLFLKIKSDINEALISSKEYDTYKDYIDYIHNSLNNKDYYTSGIYEKEYFTALVLEVLYDKN